MIYAIFLGVFIWLFSWWQKRGAAQAANRPRVSSPTSTFGRPLVKKG